MLRRDVECGRVWHGACATHRRIRVVDHHLIPEESPMTWTKPEFKVVELGMEIGAYAGNA